MDLERAVEAFANGFASAKSIVSPHVASRFGPLWILQDEPGTRRTPRLTEVVALGLSAQDSKRRIAKLGLDRHALCAIEAMNADHEKVRRDHLSVRYRLISRQPLFVAEPAAALRCPGSNVDRVHNLELAARVAKAARSRQVLPSDLDSGAPLRRLYAAVQGDEIAGWVSSIRATDEANWVANLFVLPRYRGRGVGMALMAALLADDAAHGVRWSVLLASSAGARLYPKVGYEQIGLLHLFMPADREGIGSATPW